MTQTHLDLIKKAIKKDGDSITLCSGKTLEECFIVLDKPDELMFWYNIGKDTHAVRLPIVAEPANINLDL